MFFLSMSGQTAMGGRRKERLDTGRSNYLKKGEGSRKRGRLPGHT